MSNEKGRNIQVVQRNIYIYNNVRLETALLSPADGLPLHRLSRLVPSPHSMAHPLSPWGCRSPPVGARHSAFQRARALPSHRQVLARLQPDGFRESDSPPPLT